MRKRGRKLLSMLTAATMTAAMVSGCSGGSGENQTTAVQTSAAESTAAESTVQETEKGDSQESGGAKEGTYEATEKGFGGDVTVKVTVDKDGKVTAVDVEADSETPDLGGKAAPKIAQDILDNQSLAVDAVSGATLDETPTYLDILKTLYGRIQSGEYVEEN